MSITAFNGGNLCNDPFFLCMAASSKLHVIIKHPDSRTVGGQENLSRGVFFFFSNGMIMFCQMICFGALTILKGLTYITK